MSEFRSTLREVFVRIQAIREYGHPRIRIDAIEELVKRLEELANNRQIEATAQTPTMPSAREDFHKLVNQLDNMKTRVNGQDRKVLENLIRRFNDLLE